MHSECWIIHLSSNPELELFLSWFTPSFPYPFPPFLGISEHKPRENGLHSHFNLNSNIISTSRSRSKFTKHKVRWDISVCGNDKNQTQSYHIMSYDFIQFNYHSIHFTFSFAPKIVVSGPMSSPLPSQHLTTHCGASSKFDSR